MSTKGFKKLMIQKRKEFIRWVIKTNYFHKVKDSTTKFVTFERRNENTNTSKKKNFNKPYKNKD